MVFASILLRDTGTTTARHGFSVILLWTLLKSSSLYIPYLLFLVFGGGNFAADWIHNALPWSDNWCILWCFAWDLAVDFLGMEEGLHTKFGLNILVLVKWFMIEFGWMNSCVTANFSFKHAFRKIFCSLFQVLFWDHLPCYLLQKVQSGLCCPDWDTAMHSLQLQRLVGSTALGMPKSVRTKGQMIWQV